MRPLMSSRIRRAVSRSLPAGSSSLPVLVTLAREHGAIRIPAIVMTTSDSFTASTVRILGTFGEISMPSSAVTSIATGLIWSFGSDPAERTSTRPFESACR